MKSMFARTLALVWFLAIGAWGGTNITLWSFDPNQGDAGNPIGNQLISDGLGNLYGVTYGGGANGNGAVFELSPDKRGGWKEAVRHSFGSGKDGAYPYGGLVLDQKGNLYGTTSTGGTNGTGCVYQLVASSWTESVLYSFGAVGSGDGNYPYAGVAMDSQGNLYGTTFEGGANNDGALYALAPNGDGTWSETVLHSFSNTGDGAQPAGDVLVDRAGKLFGTTTSGGNERLGTVYEAENTINGWVEQVLYSFDGHHGGNPEFVHLIEDANGNLYGTASLGGLHNEGTVWELATASRKKRPPAILHSFGPNTSNDGLVPYAGVLLGPNGSLFGTTYYGGTRYGTVFALSKGKWKEKVLYRFLGGADGGLVASAVIADSQGNLYGMANIGGTYGAGVVFEITPQAHTP